MVSFMMVFAAILLIFATYTLLAPLALNAGRFLGRFRLTCPNRSEHAEVQVHAARAALSAAYGTPDLGLRHCSLLRPGDTCNEGCLKGLAA
jgi:hypothetical protein